MTGGNPNLEIYQKSYTAAQLSAPPLDNWEAGVETVRIELINRYLHGDTGLDLCCGAGTYGLQLAATVKTVAGLDVGQAFLAAFRDRLANERPGKTGLFVQGDAMALPFAAASFDALCSFRSLYYIPDFSRLFSEIHRVLKPGGYAVLEMGNRRSVSFPLGLAFHKTLGWARLEAESLAQTRRRLKNAGLELLACRSFQILPAFGAPPGQKAWLLVSHPKYKAVLGKTIGGRLVDEWISSLPGLRGLAFRHLMVVKRS